jgi:hypothetical protein
MIAVAEGLSDGLVGDADGSRLLEAKLDMDRAEGGRMMERWALMGRCRNCVGAKEGMASLGLTPYAENNGVMRLELITALASFADTLRRLAAVPGRELNDTDAAGACCVSCFDFAEVPATLLLGRSSMRRRPSLMFFCLTVGNPMFMLVV